MNTSKKRNRILALLFLLLLLLVIILLYFPCGFGLDVGLNENKVLVPTVQFTIRTRPTHNTNVSQHLPSIAFVKPRKHSVGTGALPVINVFKAQSVYKGSSNMGMASAAQGAGGGSGFNNTGANNAMAMFGMIPIFNPNFNNPDVNNGDENLVYDLMDSGSDPSYSNAIPIGNHWFAFLLMACAYCCCIYMRLE